MPLSMSDHDFELNLDPIPLANRIDEVCDQFESAWKSGERPTIGDFLDETIAEHASALFVELVRIDMEYRALHGEIPSYDEYASQYPQFSDVLTGLRRDGALAETITVRARPEKSLGRYELINEVGGGGFGSVWRAWDTQLKRMVAIKVPRSRLGGPGEEKAFLREARAFAELEHPNIVPVYDSGTIDGTTFIASRLIEGVSLRKWMKARRLSPREIARICEQLAEAMEYAHSKGVIHRDLKPSNVLIDEKGQPHITDFGLATRKIDDVTIGPSGEIVGTPAYMSPEQVRGKPKPDPRSDVYSLGATLYEMLTGRVPFRGDQATVLLQVVGSEPEAPRKINKSIPVDLETICLKAMEKERGGRYQTAGELAADLRRFLNNEPIDGRPVGILQRFWRACRRKPGMAAAVSLAAVSTGMVMATALNSLIHGASPPLGNRLISLKTEPPGARVVFYRLSDVTGEPDSTKRIEAEGLSPVRMALPPGRYFVVAALDEKRFHEVLRYVPDLQEERSPPEGADFWEHDDDDPRVVSLPRIRIPDATIADSMVLVAGTEKFPMGIKGSTNAPLHDRSVGSFYVDRTETTCSEAMAAQKKKKVSIDLRFKEVPKDYAACIPYDHAVKVVEALGKRLPTEAEWEYVATNRGETKYPWGDDDLTVEQRKSDVIGPVGSFVHDHSRNHPQVAGLCSNVAEWTMTPASYHSSVGDRNPVSSSQMHRERVVRGPFIRRRDGSPLLGLDGIDLYDARLRRFVSRYEMNAGLGMRGFRSAKPHLESDDVVRDFGAENR